MQYGQFPLADSGVHYNYKPFICSLTENGYETPKNSVLVVFKIQNIHWVEEHMYMYITFVYSTINSL